MESFRANEKNFKQAGDNLSLRNIYSLANTKFMVS